MKLKLHKPFKGNCAYEWQIGRVVFQFHHNNTFNWCKHATLWRFNIWRAV
jgi:hypothetical protein